MSSVSATASLSLFLLAGYAGAQSTSPVDLGLVPGDLAVAPAVNTQSGLSVSKGGAQYLAVWTDSRARSSGSQTIQSDGDIFGIRVDSLGNAIDAAPFLIAGGMGLQQNARVAWNGENWLVVYESQDPTESYFGTFVRAARVSPLGQVLDAAPLQFPTDQFDPATIGLTVSGQNGQWLVARCVYHADGYGTYLAGQRIDSAGALLDPAPRVLSDWVYGRLSIIPSGTGEYLVVGPDWNASTQLKGRRVAADLQPLAPAFNLPLNSQSIAGNGAGEFYVTWISGFVNLVGSRMTASGTLLTPAGTSLVPNVQGSVSMTHDGINWWLQRNVASLAWTTRISPAGVVLDPGGVALPITIGGNVNSLYDAQILPRSGGGAIFAWTDYRSALASDGNGFALARTPSNTPAGTEQCLSTGTGNQHNPDLARGPAGTFGVAYVSQSAGDNRVLVQLFDAAGRPASPEPLLVHRGPDVGSASIAWNGSVYMVAFDAGASNPLGPGVKARRMAPDGAFIDPAPFAVMPGFAADIEALGSNFLIAAERQDSFQIINLYARRIDGATGSPLDGPSGVFLAGTYVTGHPRVRSDGARWLVLSHSQWSHNSSQGDAFISSVPPTGAPEPAFNPTPFSGGTGDPDLAFSGSNYLIAWRNNTLASADNSIAGRIMNADGSFPGPSFTIADAPGRQLRPTVTWDGSSYLVAWDDQRNQGAFFDARTGVYASRVSVSGEVLDPAGFPIGGGTEAECSPSLLSIGPSTLLATTRFVTAGGFDSYRVGLSLLGELATHCSTDFNADGTLNPDDLGDFITCYFGSPPCNRADFNHDANVNPDDLGDFITAYFLGCN